MLGKEMEHETLTCQMQYEAAEKETDKIDRRFRYLTGTLNASNTLDLQL